MIKTIFTILILIFLVSCNSKVIEEAQNETTKIETQIIETESKEETQIDTETATESIELESESESNNNDLKILEYPIFYSDETCEITIIKEWYENAWVYAAHIIYTDYDRLGTTCANGAYNFGYETTSSVASRIGAILAINGCYSAPKLNYIVVRDGVICNGGERNLCLPAIYSSNNGKLQCVWETGGCDLTGKNVTDLVNEGLVTDTFCFGPPYLINGEVLVKPDDSRAQRTFIGTNGNAGDIWLIVSDGRWNDGESSGLNGYQCAQYLASKECVFGVALDGGGSSTMVWQGEVLNAAKGNERAVVDFVYFKGDN